MHFFYIGSFFPGLHLYVTAYCISFCCIKKNIYPCYFTRNRSRKYFLMKKIILNLIWMRFKPKNYFLGKWRSKFDKLYLQSERYICKDSKQELWTYCQCSTTDLSRWHPAWRSSLTCWFQLICNPAALLIKIHYACNSFIPGIIIIYAWNGIPKYYILCRWKFFAQQSENCLHWYLNPNTQGPNFESWHLYSFHFVRNKFSTLTSTCNEYSILSWNPLHILLLSMN